MIQKTLIASALLLVSAIGGGNAFAANNPQDDVGVQHNRYLDCLRTGRVPVEEMLDYLVGQCGYKPDMSMDQFRKTFNWTYDLDPSVPLVKHMDPFQTQYTAKEFDFFRRIDEINAKAGSLENATALYERLENEAVATLDPTSRGAAGVLASLSVARHSLAYWTAVEGKREVALGGRMTTARWGWGKVLAVVGSDIAGAAITVGLGLAPAAGAVASAASNAVGQAM